MDFFWRFDLDNSGIILYEEFVVGMKDLGELGLSVFIVLIGNWF